MVLAVRTGAWSPSIAPLPYDAEVEYLESSGTQWINTGHAVNYNNYVGSEFEVRFQLLEATSLDTKLFGAIQGLMLATRLGNWRTMIGVNFVDSGVPVDTNVHTVRITESKTYMDWDKLNSQSMWRSSDNLGGPLYLFAAMSTMTNPPSIQTRSAHREFSAKISRDGIDVFNSIPVRFTNENGESEGAMYDRVSGQLFRNAGTGAFIIGPDKTT